ncbi:Hh protein intein-like-domain-containing protein [Apiosordaria backusii]|uniref:Hh protein intein-like-domain-containing protein n=1 Tax=Apiosordaria backusii TaxID=314023 RepID=A0AA40K3B9_9PEZI|nr:Hh protein intein-like-domain-containing protein [Apiosordaria backusii]
MVRIDLCNWRTTNSVSTLPLRSQEKDEISSSESLLQIHPLETEDGVIIKIDPPKEPEPEPEPLWKRNHVPLDLVLSIDVSGSMGADAPVPAKNGAGGEHYGLSVLDLVRHAAKTILETLDEGDRLGIVTFSSNSKVVRKLTSVTQSNRAKILKELDALQPLSMTNLWHGIRDGLSLFENDPKAANDSGSPGSGRVPALLVLTDGMPNHQCPSQGYVAKLRQWNPLPASIHTFGFGYSLRSGLLKSIAEVGGGNYSFIPDAGMIGTVFVHAVANLQSTFATNAELQLTYPSQLQLEETTGEAVEKQMPVRPQGDVSPKSILTISLGNLQYGQSREIYLRYGCAASYLQSIKSAAKKGSCPGPTITAVLKSREDSNRFNPNQPSRTAVKRNILYHSSYLPSAEIAYHISRSLLISFISKFYPLDLEDEHQPLQELPDDISAQLQALARSLPAVQHMSSHAGCKSLLVDLCGLNIDPLTVYPTSWTGQIALALLNKQYYFRWGKHYLPSLAGAHARQICNSFKDAGPKQYGVHSPLFISCRDKLDDAFDRLPAPKPSNAQPPVYARYTPSTPLSGSGSGSPPSYDDSDYRDEGWKWGSVGGGGGGNAYSNITINMSEYNDEDGACFAGFTLVTLANGEQVKISKLRRGMGVLTPRGERKVAAVMKTGVRRMGMVVVEGGGRGFWSRGGILSGNKGKGGCSLGRGGKRGGR